MADRLVRPIVPASDRKLRFSECLQSPNIVVLGDPGAGKSHLFRSFAPPGALFPSREFLNRSPASLQGRTTLFIDALDEKRSGRADAAPVDLIVQRLLELTPSYVRIACRAADWLGTSDLGAFRPYFDATGGFTVLALEALTEAECADVLRVRGCTDPAAFMAEAHARGVGDLLGNPQNLTLLFNVVRTHQWPHTRSELYQQAVEVLLTESNDEHQHKVAGGYSAKELVLPAGAACAARLIADVSGLSLTSTNVAGCPTYRDLAFVPAPQMHAALTRPAFVLTDASDTVDYGHRTIAEYLAARFLAQQVRDGLPFDRVRALICVEGRPASELRGVHAWLAVLLSEHAQELIKADPFGVLSYGDAAALSVSDRAVLLEAMSELAKQDPWFRHGNWSAAPLRGLAGADMVDRFRAILQRNNNFSLVSVVLDAASVGTPMPALQPDFLRILTQPTRRDGERLLALQALLHLGPTAHASCVSAYASIVAGVGGFHLRTSVLRRLFRLGLVGPMEVAELLNDALTTTPSPIIGIGLYDFAGQVPDNMLRLILDGVRLQGLPTKGPDNHQAREALQVLDRLMARYLVSDASDLHYVAAWLTARAHTTRYHGYTIDEALQAAVKSDPQRLQLLIDAALPHVQEKEAWPIVVRLGQIYLGAADMPTILTWALRKLEASPATPDPLHYGIAMECIFSPEPPARAAFEHLLTLASQNPQLGSISAAACTLQISDWRIDESERRASDAAQREQDRSTTLQNFDPHGDAIRTGVHQNWLGHIAKVYFCLYSDCNQAASPRGRVIDLLGAERADVALAGLRAFVTSSRAPAILDVLAKHADQKVWPEWYAIVAGLDEYVAANGDLGALSPDYLASAVAIDVLYPTFEHAGNTTSVIRHAWAAWFAQRNPQRFADTLLEVIRFQLQKQSQHLDGFTELLQLTTVAQAAAIRDLLLEFPRAPSNYLAQLLRAWISNQPSDPDRSLIRRGLKKSAGTATHALWLAAGLVIDFGKFRSHANALKKRDARRALIWAARDLAGHSRPVTLACTEYLLRMSCRCFERVETPSTSTGDRNHWDATQFALNLLNTVAADTSDAARYALRTLVQYKGTHRFHDDIKHAIAQQQIRRIDAQFRQPTWAAAIATLANGAPANTADLQALVLAELRDLQVHLAGSSVDLYKNFWNEGPHGQVKTPKSENSCRNALVGELSARLRRHGVRMEPEGQMAHARRTDIAVTSASMKLVMELKRHYHPQVWSAASEQLDRFYVLDPEAKGFGIYVVFWFGKHKPTPAVGKGRARPRSADEMVTALMERLPADQRLRIACVVLDVSGGTSVRKAKKSKRVSKVTTPKSSKRELPRKKRKSGKRKAR